MNEKEPLDKAEHLLKLADLASAMGDFRMAARFYKDSKKWTAFALRERKAVVQRNDSEPPA